MSYRKTFAALAAAFALLVLADGVLAQPQINPNQAKPYPGFQPKVTPQLQLKPDLIIQSMGFSQEFCLDGCGDLWPRELQVMRIAAERCAWQVTVKNQGNGGSRAGKVQVRYDSIAGPITLVADMPAIRAGQFARVVVPFNNARPRNLYWNFNTSFHAMADATNTSQESNEGNNTQDMRPHI